MPQAEVRGIDARVGVGFAALAALYALLFHLDVRERDALSWMDPYQYYDFAVDLLNGERRFDEFELPSLFPFFLLPTLAIEPSIPAALWTQLGFTGLLFWSIHRLCQLEGIELVSPWVAALVVASPLALGLSRTLYVEYALCAIVAAAFVAWIRLLDTPDARHGVVFGVLFGLGFMTKMTFPIFFALPVAAAVLVRLASGRTGEALRLGAAVIVPVAIALSIQASVFPGSFAYYQSLGNTTIPIMRLIGPPEALSVSSFFYYIHILLRFLLGLLAPMLAITLWAAWRERAHCSWPAFAGRRAVLWLWLTGPLILLIAQPVKEPRHILPCLVPAVLLIVAGIEKLPGLKARRSALAIALGLGAIQLAAVASGAIPSPYYVNQPLHVDAIETAMRRAAPGPLAGARSARLEALLWRYDQNIVTDGFNANDSLALAWHFFPAVTFDLASVEADVDSDTGRAGATAYTRFEDLYIFAAINTYNRRCGWPIALATLPRAQVIAQADFAIVRGLEPEARRRRYPGHSLVATIETRNDSIEVLRNTGTTVPYRALYARRFLARNESLAREELRLVAAEMLIAHALAGDAQRVAALQRELPVLRDRDPPHRNLYWIGGYGEVIGVADAWIRSRPAD